MKRYKIDFRLGCIAVIDSIIPPSCPGLYNYSREVIAYWEGYKKMVKNELDKEEEIWDVEEWKVEMAKKLCDLLNELDSFIGVSKNKS